MTTPAAPTHPSVDGVQRHDYDFYRCNRCFRLITAREMRRALDAGGAVQVCPCGGAKFSPTNPRWFEFLYPRVVRFACERVGTLGLAGLRENLRRDIRRWRGLEPSEPPEPDGYFTPEGSR
jgi:hypothetical protein